MYVNDNVYDDTSPPSTPTIEGRILSCKVMLVFPDASRNGFRRLVVSTAGVCDKRAGGQAHQAPTLDTHANMSTVGRVTNGRAITPIGPPLDTTHRHVVSGNLRSISVILTFHFQAV